MKPKGKPIKWSPEIAYAVGLITTDGNLSPDERHLMLISKDSQLLRTFKKCLGLKNKIGLRRSGYTGKKDCHHVQFGNVILYKWLQQKINSLLNIHGFIEHTSREFRLTFAKKESLKLLPKIYPSSNVPCLKRKYKIIQSLINKPRW